MIPGRLLHRVAMALCSATFCQRVAEPLLADFQHEWREAKGLWQRVSALASGYGAFWCTFVFHAGHVWRNEILALTWRDAFPFPGAYAVLVVLIAVSNDWVRTGTIGNIWSVSIDSRPSWAMVPLVVAQRWISLTSGIRILLIGSMLALPGATFLWSVDVFRTLLRGWVPFAIVLLVIMLVQPKKRRAV